MGLVLVAALGAFVWVLDYRSNEAPERGVSESVAHVHALGVNPGDDMLYAATHYGLFRIADDGTATRVSDSYQDTMGFTVVGPDQFLGSGHPDLPGRQAGQPALLGLIGSTDSGESWESLSLSGVADFHGLAFVDDVVYGWDATTGAFMVSLDRRSWERRSTIDMFGFAVEPVNGSSILAAGPRGVSQSSDGGRTWSEPTGPQLVALTVDPRGRFWGADGDGQVWTTGDGSAWDSIGRIDGQAQAVFADNDSVWIALHGDDRTTTITRTDDDGRSWTTVYREPPPLAP